MQQHLYEAIETASLHGTDTPYSSTVRSPLLLHSSSNADPSTPTLDLTYTNPLTDNRRRPPSGLRRSGGQYNTTSTRLALSAGTSQHISRHLWPADPPPLPSEPPPSEGTSEKLSGTGQKADILGTPMENNNTRSSSSDTTTEIEKCVIHHKKQKRGSSKSSSTSRSRRDKNSSMGRERVSNASTKQLKADADCEEPVQDQADLLLLELDGEELQPEQVAAGRRESLLGTADIARKGVVTSAEQCRDSNDDEDMLMLLDLDYEEVDALHDLQDSVSDNLPDTLPDNLPDAPDDLQDSVSDILPDALDDLPDAPDNLPDSVAEEELSERDQQLQDEDWWSSRHDTVDTATEVQYGDVYTNSHTVTDTVDSNIQLSGLNPLCNNNTTEKHAVKAWRSAVPVQKIHKISENNIVSEKENEPESESAELDEGNMHRFSEDTAVETPIYEWIEESVKELEDLGLGDADCHSDSSSMGSSKSGSRNQLPDIATTTSTTTTVTDSVTPCVVLDINIGTGHTAELPIFPHSDPVVSCATVVIII